MGSAFEKWAESRDGSYINAESAYRAGYAAAVERLDEYLRHLATCAMNNSTYEQIDRNIWPTCTCGLDAALKGDDA